MVERLYLSELVPVFDDDVGVEVLKPAITADMNDDESLRQYQEEYPSPPGMLVVVAVKTTAERHSMLASLHDDLGGI